MANINILGQDYKFHVVSKDSKELNGADGICSTWGKEIFIRKYSDMGDDTNNISEKSYRYDHVVLHELIHAFAEESGVQYGEDEALVDWIATMIPKINLARDEVGVDYGRGDC